MTSRLTRRRFVKAVAAGLGAAPVVLAHAAPSSRWRFFTEEEARLAEAIVEQVIPADQDPGARDAGVVNFLDKQLAGRYRRHQQIYREGLRGVDEISRVMFKSGFVALNAGQQINVLKSLDAGKIKDKTDEKQSSAAFFSLIRDHAMQGFYGGPQHGGNRACASYKMLGIDYPQIIGQNRYRKK
jgi:gluconate 2-dehydrogenase gamma chain